MWGSVSRSLEEAARDPVWPGPPTKNYRQTTLPLASAPPPVQAIPLAARVIAVPKPKPPIRKERKERKENPSATRRQPPRRAAVVPPYIYVE